MAEEKHEALATARAQGWETFDVVGEMKEKGILGQVPERGWGSTYLDEVIQYFAMKHPQVPGVPPFRPIVNRVAFYEDQEPDPEQSPLNFSPRLQLKLPDIFIRDTPIAAQLDTLLRGIFGECAKLRYSILFSEGLNALRWDEKFIEMMKKKKIELPVPEIFITEEWLARSLRHRSRYLGAEADANRICH